MFKKPNLMTTPLTNIYYMLDDKYPARTKLVMSNSVKIKGLPIWPKFLTPKGWVYFRKRNRFSLKECWDVFMGVNNLNELKAHKSSQKLAILGSGASINAMTQDDFAFISSIDSMALNKWGLHHKFIPDFYKFELTLSMYEDWIDGMNAQSNSYRDTIFIYEPERMYAQGFNTAELLSELNSEIVDGLVDIRIFQYHINTDDEYNLGTMKVLFPTSFGSRIFHQRGSLSQALSMGYYLGYDDIILYGVDLNHSGYFWENQNLDNDRQASKNRHPTAQHRDTKGVQEFINFVYDNILNPEGIGLYVADQNSLLYPKIPDFNLDQLA